MLRISSTTLSLPQFSIPAHLQALRAATALGNGQVPTSFTRGMAKKSKSKKGAPTDVRIKLIRYSLYHPKTPRPLRFGTMRMLRHWTIHRAWKLYQATQRKERGYELERQYNKMRDACEELRLTSQGLYERAVAKSIFRYPIVEFRIPTDTPAQIGWNHEWKRG